MKLGKPAFHSVKTRTIAMFLFVVVLLLIAATAVSFFVVDRQEHENDKTTGLEAANICAAVVEFAIGGNFSNSDSAEFKPGTTDYDECQKTLRSLCRIEEMAYLYVYMVDEDAGTMTYIMAVSSDPERDKAISQARPYGTTVNTSHLSAEDWAIVQGKSDEHIVSYHNSFGNMLDCIAPIGNSGLFAAASYSVNDQHSRIIASTLTTVAHLIIALLILLVGQLIVLQRHVMKPLRKISNSMKEFTPERAHDFESIGITTKDELGEIASSFEGMAASIATYLDDIEQMTEERVQVDVELDVAQRIQQGMVPKNSSIEGSAADVYAFSRSAKNVGGDFYDIIERDDGSIAIVIGDVSGKGVAAALFMAMSKESIRIELSSTDKTPAEILMSVNENLCQHNPEGMFVTSAIAEIDEDGHVTIANAGHLAPMRVSDEASVVACSAGCLMGLFDDAEIVDEHLDLEPGETLLLYTDGASEAVNANKEFLGDEAIRDHLSQRAPFDGVRDVLDELVGAVDGFAAQAEQFDDLTAIALRRHSDGMDRPGNGTGASNNMTELEADISSFAPIRAEIMDGPEKTQRLRACLACEEMFANIVSYSGANHAFYSVSEKDGKLTVVLGDDGEPFDPLMAKPIDKEFEELDSGGMGIKLVKDIASNLSYQRSSGRNVLTLEFDLNEEQSDT